jgi:RNA polymerase sigma-70 factor (ECF subfamily)
VTAKPAAEEQIRALLADHQLDAAAALLVQTFGPEIMSYLVAILGDEADAGDAFGVFCTMLWEGLPRFRGDCTARTWAYVLARRALSVATHDRDRARRQVQLAPTVEAVAAQVRSATPEYAKTESRERLARLRRALKPADRMLLVLRVNRRLAWQDIARIMADDDALDGADLARRAAVLRKQFERLKDELRAHLGREPDSE